MTVTRAHEGKTDREILLDVLAELDRDPRFGPGAVGVEVDDGTVTLTGTVSDYVKLGEAARLATGVVGVQDVANKLVVEPPGARDDTAIARAVRHALEWEPLAPEARIDSVVRNGVVTLTGTVDHAYQRSSAVDAAKHLLGVKAVNDHIVVVPAPREDDEIFDDVKAGLFRRLPGDEVDVSVARGIVTLMGRVSSRWVRDLAEDVAWGTKGVRDVVNRTRIGR